MSSNSVAQNRRFWDSYDWSGAGDEWSGPWGGTRQLWYGALMPRINANLPARSILEIAPGSGRFTQFLKDYCQTYTGVDLSTTCVENCRQRFQSFAHMTFHVNDGLSLAMVPDDSVDFVFSHDSLVHAEADVLESYLRQLATKLVPGGTGYFHFSNFLKVREKEAATGATPVVNTHARAENMSGELFADYCRQAGLALLGLELVDWGPTESDGLAFFARLPAAAVPAPQVVVNSGFMAEAARLRQLGSLFSRPDTADPPRPRRDPVKSTPITAVPAIDVSAPSLLQSDDVDRFFAGHSDRDDKTLWVFHHIPKTAGSSLANDLASYFMPSCNLYPGAFGDDAVELGPLERINRAVTTFLERQREQNVRFAHGHLRRSHIELLKSSLPRVSVFTMLRDPFARTISAYRYKQSAKLPDSSAFIAEYPTFDSFLDGETGDAFINRNACCKYLVGSRNATYEQAREILDKDYVFCGLLEAWPLSFAVISTLMGRQATPRRHDNRSPDKVPNEVIDPEKYRSKIYKINAEDVKLFNFARDRLMTNREKIWQYIKRTKATPLPVN